MSNIHLGNKEWAMGNVYYVLCARAHWPHATRRTQKPEWIPILEPRHNDLEIINFRFDHYHVDYRFLDEKFAKLAEHDPLIDAPINKVYLHPISAVVPENAQWPILLDGLPNQTYPIDTYIQYRRKKYKRDFPITYGEHNRFAWFDRLQDAYKDERLIDNICPHKEANLILISSIGDTQIVQCPLHGLRWNRETGEFVWHYQRQPVSKTWDS